MGGGKLTVDGALASTDAYYGPGHSLEFVATFGANTSQHIGFGTDLNAAPWAIFSTGYPGGTTLLARTDGGSGSIDTNLGSYLGAPHRYRIDWTATGVTYTIDGVQVASHSTAISTSMRPVASDQAGGPTLLVDWLRMSPYAPSGSFTSRLFDAGAAHWLTLNWTGSTPAGTTVGFDTRSGNTSNPDDGTWSGWSPVNGATVTSPDSRYVQYRATLTTGTAASSPVVESVTLIYDAPAIATPTNTPVPPTATNTPTNTPVPPLPTDTPTNTPVPPLPTDTPTNTPVPPLPTDTPTNTPVPPLPTDTPTNTPVPPLPTDTPTNTPVAPLPTDTPTNTPVAPLPTDTPTNTPVAPLPTDTPTNTPVAPLPTDTPTNTPVAPLPTDTPTNTPTPLSDMIFSDGFESGSLTAWTSSVTNGGALSVSPSAALVGAYGLRAAINSNTAIYVTDDTPSAEARYRARFYFDPNSISMSNGNAHYIFYGYSGTSTVVLRIEFRYATPSRQLRAALVNNATTWSTSSWFTISDAPHYVEIDWAAATAAGANNGYLTLWIDGTQRANLTGVANDTRRIDRVRLGAVNGIDSGTRGTYYFDEFVSRRQTYIGP